MATTEFTTENLAAFLTELVVLDRQFMTDLVNTRHPCNEAILSHPFIQVLCNDDMSDARAGFLGVLCGIAEKFAGRRLAANFDDADQLVGFSCYTNPEGEG